jgi:sugar lactone lactonase YvrE
VSCIGSLRRAALLALAAGALGACTGEDDDPPCPEDAGTLCRVIGTGTLGFNGEGLAAEESWLYFPSAVRVHPDGRLVVVDFNNMRVRALDPDGTLVTIAGNGEHAWSTPGAQVRETALENPIDAVYAPDGTLYILPLHEARVVRVGADGIANPCAGTGDIGYDGDGGDATLATLSEASGLAVGDDGALYVADTQNNAIRVVEDGVIRTLAGAAEAGFVDGVGAEARFSGPQRIAVGEGTLYVADANNHAIRAVDLTTGAVTTVAGTGARGYAGDGGAANAALLMYPYGVNVGSDSALWIADSGNNVVRRVRDGLIETVAGTGVEGFTGDDGPAVDATFAFPVHMVEHDGSLYVADMKNGAVRAVRGVE